MENSGGGECLHRMCRYWYIETWVHRAGPRGFSSMFAPGPYICGLCIGRQMTKEERAATTRAIEIFLEGQWTLRDICRWAGIDYQRVRTAMYRYREGQGRGVSARDADKLARFLRVHRDEIAGSPVFHAQRKDGSHGR